MELSMSEHKAVTKKEAVAYKNADEKAKTQILNELVEPTGWHRDYGRAA